jgi:hypothetical protein
MPPGNHVHIISAGESVQTAFAALLRTLPGITRTYVIASGEPCGTVSNPETEKERVKTLGAVEEIRTICGSLSIPYSREMVFSPTIPSVRTVLAKIRRENPYARFTFDLSGGPKPLCLALFAFAPWLGGEVYSSFEGKAPQGLAQPGRDIPELLRNVNYPTILAVLLRNRPVPPGPELPYTPRDYLFSQVWPYYVRQRARKAQPGDPIVQFKRGRKPANDLSQATFSWFMKTLVGAGLVEERPPGTNRRETSYRITENGITAFRFFADPTVNSVVKDVLDRA